MATTRDFDVLETLKKLPPMCFIKDRTGRYPVIAVKRGVMGYYPIQTRLTADELNATLDPVPTPAQVMAMEVGSMNGWDCPGADPDICQQMIEVAERRKAVAAC